MSARISPRADYRKTSRIVEVAIENPARCFDDARGLFAALLPHSGQTSEATEKNKATARDRVFAKYETIPPSKLAAVNFIKELMRADGQFDAPDDVGGLNEQALSVAIGYNRSYLQHCFATEEVSYEFLCRLVDRKRNPLNLKRMPYGALDISQIDALFGKAEKTHWRPDTLRENAKEMMQKIRSRRPLFYEAVRMLLPVDYMANNRMRELMAENLPEGKQPKTPVSNGRVQQLLSGKISFPDIERQAALKVVQSHTGIDDTDIDFCGTLNSERKLFDNEFSDKLRKMLTSYVDQKYRGVFSLAASYRYFIALTPQTLLTANGLKDIVERPMGVITAQTARVLVNGFDALALSGPDSTACAIQSDINELLNLTPYRRTTLFLNANQVVEQFDESALWPEDALDSRIGRLLHDVRNAWGLDLSLRAWASLSKLPVSTLNNYVSICFQIIPVKNDARTNLPKDQDDNLDRMIIGLNTALRNRNQPELTNDNIGKIRRIATQSYKGFRDLSPRERAVTKFAHKQLGNAAAHAVHA